MRLRRRGTGGLLTHRWRGLDSNFQYAGAVNLVVAPFMPPKARDGSGRPLSFRTARRPASKRRGPDRRGRNPCRRRTAPNFAWSGKKTATLYRVTAPADPVLVHGNRLVGAKGQQPVPFIAVWKSDLVGSGIDPLHGVSASAPPTLAGALVSAEPSTAPPSPDLPRGTLPRSPNRSAPRNPTNGIGKGSAKSWG